MTPGESRYSCAALSLAGAGVFPAPEGALVNALYTSQSLPGEVSDLSIGLEAFRKGPFDLERHVVEEADDPGNGPERRRPAVELPVPNALRAGADQKRHVLL